MTHNVLVFRVAAVALFIVSLKNTTANPYKIRYEVNIVKASGTKVKNPFSEEFVVNKHPNIFNENIFHTAFQGNGIEDKSNLINLLKNLLEEVNIAKTLDIYKIKDIPNERSPRVTRDTAEMPKFSLADSLNGLLTQKRMVRK